MPNETMFFQTLQQNINVSIESDLLSIYPTLNGNTIKKIKKLLSIIMKNVPFTPNISALKKSIDVKDDRTLKEYLVRLDDAGLIILLMKSSQAMKSLDKPEKIYIANTNLMYTAKPDLGNLRETFFVNQVQNHCAKESTSTDAGIYTSHEGDFYVSGRYTFEISGKNKRFNQIKDMKDSFVVADDLEVGFKHKIPLWLFGFLY